MTHVLATLVFIHLMWVIFFPESWGRMFADMVNKFERGYRSMRRG